MVELRDTTSSTEKADDVINISKLKVSGVLYDIKDAELRYMIDILLGRCEQNMSGSSGISTINENTQIQD